MNKGYARVFSIFNLFQLAHCPNFKDVLRHVLELKVQFLMAANYLPGKRTYCLVIVGHEKIVLLYVVLSGIGRT